MITLVPRGQEGESQYQEGGFFKSLKKKGWNKRAPVGSHLQIRLVRLESHRLQASAGGVV